MVFVLVGCATETEKVEEVTNETKKPIKLMLATFFPASHKIVEVANTWADTVEEVTDGLVEVDVYPGETLLGAADMYEGVIQGVADIGHAPTSHTPGQHPLLTSFLLGGIDTASSKVASQVAWDIVKEGAFELDEVKDTHFLFLYAISPGSLHTREPVRTLEDLKGMQLRSVSIDTVNLLGASPAAIPMAETYEAVEKGVVDGVLAPCEVLEGFRLAEVTNYTIIAPFLYCDIHYFTMNLDTWNSLPPDIQQKIEEVNKKVFDELASSLWDEIDESAINFAIEETGHEIIYLSEEEKERWVNLLIPAQEKWIETMESRGLPGREMLETVKRLMEKYQ